MFQQIIESILQGIPSVITCIDHILITDRIEEEHLQTLDKVVGHQEGHSLRLKQRKCPFLLPSVEYLGHRIFAKRLCSTANRVRAIMDAPAPTNVSQLHSFLGLLK